MKKHQVDSYTQLSGLLSRHLSGRWAFLFVFLGIPSPDGTRTTQLYVWVEPKPPLTPMAPAGGKAWVWVSKIWNSQQRNSRGLSTCRWCQSVFSQISRFCRGQDYPYLLKIIAYMCRSIIYTIYLILVYSARMGSTASGQMHGLRHPFCQQLPGPLAALMSPAEVGSLSVSANQKQEELDGCLVNVRRSGGL